MNICILYATYSGGTETAAQTLLNTLKEKGHTVTISSPSTIKPGEVTQTDCTIFCTPTWDVNGNDGQPHEDFFKLMDAVKGQSWDGHRFAILGLGDSSYPHFCGSVDVLESFVASMKGSLALPSLRIDGFFYNQAENTQKIIAWARTLS
jgi:flavodoxin I